MLFMFSKVYLLLLVLFVPLAFVLYSSFRKIPILGSLGIGFVSYVLMAIPYWMDSDKTYYSLHNFFIATISLFIGAFCYGLYQYDRSKMSI